MAEAGADSEKISVALEIRGDAETRERTRNRLLETLQEFRDTGAARGTCMIRTAEGIKCIGIGTDK